MAAPSSANKPTHPAAKLADSTDAPDPAGPIHRRSASIGPLTLRLVSARTLKAAEPISLFPDQRDASSGRATNPSAFAASMSWATVTAPGWYSTTASPFSQLTFARCTP